jgi:hypothetical protein
MNVDELICELLNRKPNAEVLSENDEFSDYDDVIRQQGCTILRLCTPARQVSPDNCNTARVTDDAGYVDCSIGCDEPEPFDAYVDLERSNTVFNLAKAISLLNGDRCAAIQAIDAEIRRVLA